MKIILIKKFLAFLNRGIWTIIFILSAIFFGIAAIVAFFNDRYIGAIFSLIIALAAFIGIFKKSWKKGLDWLD